MKLNIRVLYLYLFSFIGLLIVTFGSISLVDITLKTYVFKEADRYEIYTPEIKQEGQKEISKEEQQARQERELIRTRQRELSNALAMIVIGIPLYVYHWKTLQKENKKDRE